MKQQMNKERRRLLTNRILSVVLSVAMVWSAVPMSATAAGDASTDAKATATQGQAAAVDMGLSLSHAYIKHGGNSEATQSKKISLPTGKDFSFTAAPDTGYEITEVYTSLNSKPAGNSNKKVLKAFEHGLTPIICCGESLEQREQGITLDWIRQQIKIAFLNVTADQAKTAVIAYEPIWAIGTGKTATSDQAEEVCGAIRACIKELYDDATGEAIRIQYGGSVNAGNAAELFAKPDIDGGLVGGASLKEEFGKIVNYK